MPLSRALMLLTLLALAFPVTDAAAQARPGVRMIVGVGGGRGGAKFTCDGCLSQRQNEPTGYVRVGRRIGQAFVVGGEIDAWRTQNSDKTSRQWLSSLDAYAQFYPRPGFFVQGGAGLGIIRNDADINIQGVPYNVSQTASGLGFHVGAGYEFQIAPHVAVAPFATYFGTTGIQFDDVGSENGQVFNLGIGLVVN
jgi:opacity protein-like surface antigen